MRRLVTVDCGDAEDEPELLEYEKGQIGTQRTDRQQTGRESRYHSCSGTADGGPSRQHARVIDGLPVVRRSLLHRDNFCPHLLCVDLFKERPEDFFQNEVGAFLQRKGSDHVNRTTSCRTWFRTRRRMAHFSMRTRSSRTHPSMTIHPWRTHPSMTIHPWRTHSSMTIRSSTTRPWRTPRSRTTTRPWKPTRSRTIPGPSKSCWRSRSCRSRIL